MLKISVKHTTKGRNQLKAIIHKQKESSEGTLAKIFWPHIAG